MKFALALAHVVAAGLLASALASSPAAAQTAPGDPVRGRRLYMQCAACHSADKGGRAKIGPNLYGIVGDKAGTRAGFAYSDKLAKSGVVWTPATLDAWLKRPSALVPGNQMAFGGMSAAKDRADLIAYLKSLEP